MLLILSELKKAKTFSVLYFQVADSFSDRSIIDYFYISMASFSAPFIFMAQTDFTTEIFNAKINGDNSFASALSVLLAVISVTF